MLQGSTRANPALAAAAFVAAALMPLAAEAQASQDPAASEQIVGDVLPRAPHIDDAGEAMGVPAGTGGSIEGKRIVPVLSLVGQRVSNLQGERLGTVRDVVFGAGDGVVRAVVAVRSAPGPTYEPKLVAVPLAAFRLTHDDELIVNADTAELAALPTVNIDQEVASAGRSGLLVPEDDDSPLLVIRPRPQTAGR